MQASSCWACGIADVDVRVKGKKTRNIHDFLVSVYYHKSEVKSPQTMILDHVHKTSSQVHALKIIQILKFIKVECSCLYFDICVIYISI